MEGIVVLPTTDQFDSLWLEQVNGVNRNILTADIVQELRRLEREFGIDITGNGECFLKRISQGEEAHCLGQWLHEFCSDMYYEAPLTFSDGRIVLWWD